MTTTFCLTPKTKDGVFQNVQPINFTYMKKIILSVLFVAFSIYLTFCSKYICRQWRSYSRTLEFKGIVMELNGFGVRSKMWIDVYVQALYQSFTATNLF